MVRESVTLIFVIVVAAAFLCVAIDFYMESRGGNFLRDDSLPEEIVEDVIEEGLGVPRGTVDITPDSPEQ